ncbi:MAG TPA: hypothetical protein VEK11_04540 [Thermoanaerobaculia bacterium]|nr:hypothetical protein [Thermoanaerobaculia bacterium]
MPKIRDLGINSIPIPIHVKPAEDVWLATGGAVTSACGDSSCEEDDASSACGQSSCEDRDHDHDDNVSTCGHSSCEDHGGKDHDGKDDDDNHPRQTTPFAPEAIAKLRQQLEAHLGNQQ